MAESNFRSTYQKVSNSTSSKIYWEDKEFDSYEEFIKWVYANRIVLDLRGLEKVNVEFLDVRMEELFSGHFPGLYYIEDLEVRLLNGRFGRYEEKEMFLVTTHIPRKNSVVIRELTEIESAGKSVVSSHDNRRLIKFNNRHAKMMEWLRNYVPIIILSDSDEEMEVCDSDAECVPTPSVKAADEFDDTECVPTHFEGTTTEAGEASESVPTLSVQQTAEKEITTESVPTLSEEEANKSGGEDLQEKGFDTESVPTHAEHVGTQTEEGTEVAELGFSSDEILDEYVQSMKGKRKMDESASEQPAKKSRKSSKKKASSSIPPPPAEEAYSELFYFESSQEACEMLFQRKLIPERSVDLLSYKPSGFSKFLDCLGMKRAATVFQNYNKHLVCELYSNLQSDILESESAWSNRVYLRGQVIEFSAERINAVLGLETPNFDGVFEELKVSDDEILREISGGIKSAWPRIGYSQASCLTSRFFGLYQIAVNCWLASSNTTALTRDMAKLIFCVGTQRKVNLGLLIFQAIVKLAVTPKAKMALIHPCLLTEIARLQGVRNKPTDEIIEPELLKANKRTFGLRKVHDLPWNPKKEGSSSKKGEMKSRLMAVNARLGAIAIQMAALEAEKKELEGEKAKLLG